MALSKRIEALQGRGINIPSNPEHQPDELVKSDLELLDYHPRRNWLDYVKRYIPNLLARVGFK